MCKRVFRVKLFVSSIHSCIHHHLYPNTKKDMAWMVSRLLQLLLVAYQPRIGGRPPQDNIHTACANVCSEWKGGRSPSLFIISSVILLLLSSSSRSIQEDDEDNTHHYYFYHHHSSLCPKSTWTQEKCSQIHLNVLISSKFTYFASTPTFIISPSSWPAASIFNFCGSESHGDHAWVRGSRQTRLLLYNIINNNNYFNPFTPARIIKIIHAITIQNKKYWPEVRVSERER
jgi:hypothetical protein